jgi:hypothetical protein
MDSGRTSVGFATVCARPASPIVGTATPLLRHRPVTLTRTAQPSQCDGLSACCRLQGYGSLRFAEVAALRDAQPIGSRCHSKRIGGKS